MNIFRLACLALGFLVAAPACQASVQISSGATKNMSCSAGVCSPTAKNAVLSVSDLTGMLASADVTVKSGAQAVTIGVLSPLAWASTHRLTLDAALNVNIKASVMVQGTAGLTIVTNDGGSGGDVIFDAGQKIDFWDLSSSLIINGNSYTLVGDIQTLATDIAANPAGFYALANDYDASVDGTYSTPPIDTESTGTIEGLGHTISNLHVSSDPAALFAKASGTLRDVGLQDVEIHSFGDAASLLVQDDAATIVGCYTKGGIIGDKEGILGGLVATSGTPGGSIIRSHTSIYVNNDGETYSAVGGLVGAGSGLNILLSSASGRVDVSSSSSSLIGGLVGQMSGGSISQSFATGSVRGRLGGGVGGLIGSAMGGVSIHDSYATGAVTTTNDGTRGGFAGGIVNSVVRSSYSIGPLNGGFKLKYQGGFVGNSGDGLKWDYWDIDTSNITQGCGSGDCKGVTGLSDAQMKTALPAGLNSKVWAQDPSINNGYPYLLANPPPE